MPRQVAAIRSLSGTLGLLDRRCREILKADCHHEISSEVSLFLGSLGLSLSFISECLVGINWEVRCDLRRFNLI